MGFCLLASLQADKLRPNCYIVFVERGFLGDCKFGMDKMVGVKN